MEQNNFILDLIASLKKTQSQKQIKEDIKNLGDFKLPLIGTLSKSKTRTQLKQDLTSINGTVNLTGKVNNKGITTSVQQATQQAQKAVDSKPLEVAFSVKKEKLLNDIKLLAQQNSKLFKDTDMSIKYNSLLDNAEMAKNSVELSTLRTQLGSLRSELKVTGNAGMTMTDALKNGLSKVLQLFGSTGIIMQFTAQLRNAWTEAKELDKAMTDLSRVNAAITREGFPEYLDRVISKTKQLAVATKDYIDAVTTFSRAGYNLTDSEILADMAVQLEKVGDMDSVSASKALLAGLQGYDEIDGYGMDQLTEKAQALNDKIDLIGNTASITQKEVSEGIQTVGSVMNDANTSVDEFIALLGAGNRAVQNSNKVALAIRTSALRIRGCTVELQEMGEETDSVIESTSTLAEKIKALTNINGSGGVNILEADEETFRSIYDIYNDIAKVYDKMSDKDASALLDLIAGKNRSNQVSAILQNMSEANELLERSLNAAGTASEEYEIYLNSAQAASERFSVAMTETYSNILNGETVKGLTNAGASVLEFANSWNILEGTIKGFLALGILKGVTTLTVAFKNSSLQISNYGKALNAVKDLNVYAQGTVKYTDALDTLKSSCINLTDAQLKQILANRNLSNSQLIQILQLKELEAEEQEARLAQLGLIQTTETQTVANGMATASTFSLKAAIIGLGTSIKTAIMSNPVGFAIMAISTAIGVATSAISKYNQQLEETRQKNIESATTASENADKLKDLYNEYNRLSSIQDRTTSEEEAFKTAVENITIALGSKAEILKDLTAGTDEYADALARVTKEELQSQAVTATIGRKSAEEELQGEIWSDWKGSKVSIDSNSKGKSLSSEAQKAVAIVSDSLKEYETVNRKWGNISWDISSDDPTEALEFYNSLVEAREKLVSASGDDEALLDTEIYEDLNTAINTISESLDTYIEKLYAEEKINYMAQNGIPSVTEEYKTMESALVSAAGSSVDLQDRFKELLTNDFSELAVNIEDVSNAVSEMTEQMESVSPALSLSETINQLNTQIKPAFDALKSAWQDIFTDDEFALSSIDIISTCDSIKEKLDEMSELGLDVDYSAYEHFIDILNSSDSTVNDVKESFNQLAASITQAGVSGAEDFETMKAALEDLGVINEEIVAFSALINNTGALMDAGLDLANATDAQIAAFVNEMVSAENVSQAIAMLTFQKELCAVQDMNTTAEVANLRTLAENAGYTGEVIQYLTELEQIYQTIASGVLGTNNQQVAMAQERARQLTQLIAESGSKVEYKPQIDFSGATKAAGSAGKEAGKSYKDGLKEELSDLEGIISSLSKAIDDQKEVISSQKEVALDAIESQISALEAERDARLEAIEAEKKALQDSIKAIDKQIDAKKKEIDAINDAAKARQHEIDLQKAQYDLDRMQNQRTILQYSEDKGMHYINDSSGVRDAKEAVDDAKRQLAIDAIEKEIDLLEEQKDLLNEQIDLLDEQAESIKNFYDAQIKSLEKQKESTEKYFESLMKSIEGSKDKYQELLDIVDKAELSGKLKKLGIDEEALLNGSEEEFEKLKNAYLDVVFQVNEGNEEMLSSLRELSGYEGTAPIVLTDTTEKLDEMNEQLDTSTESMSKLSDSATTASEGTSAIATSMEELSTNTEGVSDNLTNINDALTDIPGTNNLDNITTSFTNLGKAIQTVADALGIGEEGAVSTLITALQEIGTLSLDGTDGEGVITQFQNLKTAVEDVTSAISGGGSSGGQEGDASTSSSPSMSSGTGGEDANGLLGAIEEIKSVTDKALGGGGEGEESEGEGSGAIPQFQELKTAVDDVTAAIGIEDSEGSEGSENTLIGALRTQYETASEVLPEEKTLFDELLESIMSCVSALNSMVSVIGLIPEIGGFSGISVTPYAKGTVGNAFANGTGKYKGLPKAEKNALVSEYGQTEMTVLPNGKTIITDEPTMMDLPKDTVIFNEEQTKKIMSNKVDASGNAKVVKSYTNGTVEYSDGTIITHDGHTLRPLQPGDKGWDLMQAFQPLVDKMLKGEADIVSNAVFDGQKQMEKWTKEITNNTAINNVTNNRNVQPVVNHISVTCPGVTEQQVAERLGNVIGKELDKQFSGFHNYTDQMSRIR